MYNPHVSASELKKGDTFKLTPRQSKEHWVQSVVHLDNLTTKIPKEHIGKILIVTGQCKQLIMDPEQMVFRISSPLSQSSKTELL